MRTIEMRQGRELARQLPVPLGVEEFDALVQTYERVLAVEHEGEATIAQLSAEFDQARAEDRDKLGQALIEGGAKPKESAAVATLEGKLATATRDLEGAVQARRKIAAQIEESIAANATSWVRRFDDEIAAELEGWAEELRALENRAERIADMWARRNWADGAARGEKRVKFGALTVPGLLAPNRDEQRVAAVLEALHGVGKPVVRERPKTMQQLQEEHIERERERQERRRASETPA
jgi:hypothetical protein